MLTGNKKSLFFTPQSHIESLEIPSLEMPQRPSDAWRYFCA